MLHFILLHLFINSFMFQLTFYTIQTSNKQVICYYMLNIHKYMYCVFVPEVEHRKYILIAYI